MMGDKGVHHSKALSIPLINYLEKNTAAGPKKNLRRTPYIRRIKTSIKEAFVFTPSLNE